MLPDKMLKNRREFLEKTKDLEIIEIRPTNNLDSYSYYFNSQKFFHKIVLKENQLTALISLL